MKTLEKEEVSMDSKSQEIYSELSAFLDSIDEERRNKIPEDLRELINSKKDNNYTPKYPKGTPLEKLKMKKEKLGIVCGFTVKLV